MKRLHWKIFAFATSVTTSLALAAVLIAPEGSFAGADVLGLVALGAGASLALSFVVARMTLLPLDEIRALAAEFASGKRSQRLLWSFGDERDATAVSVNRMADRLGREIEDARREAQQLEAVLAGMVEGVLVLDVQDRIVLVNPGFRELFGTWGPVRDRRLIEVVRRPEIDDLLTEAASAREPVVRDLPVRAGTDRTVLAHAVRFPSEGPPSGTLAVFHDVTDVRRVDKVRRDFIANASHELRTPLTSIQGFAETLANGGLSPEDAERCLQTILRNVGRMRHLIDDLMQLSRIENEAEARDPSRVDVVKLTRDLLLDLRKRLASAEIEAELVTASAPDAWCDRSALEHVLENLLTNAIRYTDAGGRIRVCVESKADLLEVSVEDTGIGIPEYARDRIFERFYRVDAARSRAVGSTGLGLAIVRHLVQAMHGTIRVESEIGVGSRFVFTVPRARDEAGKPPEATPPPS